jgi:hypothetical protein
MVSGEGNGMCSALMVDGNGNECIDGMADGDSTAMSASMVDINGNGRWAMGDGCVRSQR